MGKTYRTIKKTAKVILIALAILIMLPLAGILLLQIPALQNIAKEKVTHALSEKLEVQVRIERLNFGLTKDLIAEGIYLEDRNEDTLLYARDLKVNISFIRLLRKEIYITYASLEGAYLNAYRSSGNEDFNFTFILDAFADTSQTKTASSWETDLEHISLKKVTLVYHDTPGGIFLDSRINALEAEFKDLGIENNHLQIRKAEMERSSLALSFKTPEIKTPEKKGPEWRFSIGDLQIEQSDFIYNNFTIPAASRGIDYNRMNFTAVTGSAGNIEIKGKDLALEVLALALREKSGFALNNLAGKLDLNQQGIGVELDELKTPFSSIDDRTEIFIPSGSSAPAADMKLRADWEEERIAVRDLLFFVPALDTIPILKGKTAELSGKLNGTLNDFTLDDLSLAADRNTSLKGDFHIKELTGNAYAEMNIKELKLDHQLLSELVPALDTIVRQRSLGSIQVNGSVRGYLSDADLDLRVVTSAGTVSADVRIKADSAFRSFAYSGSVNAAGFNLEKTLVAAVPVRSLSMSVSASGKDSELQAFNGKIAALEYQGYTWQNIRMNGSILKKMLNGELHSEDKNFMADLNLKADLNHNHFYIDGEIDHANLQALKFIQTPLLVQTAVKGEVHGTDPDSLEGTIVLTELGLDNTREKYLADSVTLLASMDNRNHTFSLEMPEASAILSGSYNVKELPLVISYLVNRYRKPDYPEQGFPRTENASLRVKAGDLSKLARLFLPEVAALDSLHILAAYKKEGQEIQIESSLDRLKYKQHDLRDIHLQGSGAGAAISFILDARSFTSGENLIIDQTKLTGDLSRGSGLFRLEMFDQRSPTHLNMDGIMVISDDTLNLNMPSAEIMIRGKKWNIDRNNSLVYTEGYLVVEDFMLKQGEQKISVDTRLTSKDQIIDALFENVHLNELAEAAGMSSYQLKGKLDGNVTVHDPAGSQVIKSKLTIDSLGLNNIFMGNLTVAGNKGAGEKPLFLNGSLIGKDNEVRMNGQLSFTGERPVDMDLDLVRLSLEPLEPFARSFAYNIDGKASGNFKINGTLSSPILTGVLSFDGPNTIGIMLSNTLYKVENQKIYFKESSIEFNRFVVKDMLNNEAYINGSIYHKGFKSVRLALNLTAENFQMINSKAYEGALIYGQLFTKLNAKLTGPADDLEVYVNASTLKGSRVFLPLASARPEAAIPAYVRFQPIESAYTDSLARADTTDRKGMPLPDIDYAEFLISGDLRITDDAEINIVVDPMNGDRITARGDGTFAFTFDQHNNINLYGVYTVEEGSYGFSFANLVRKNFKLEKGSTISWTGDFENAALDINAAYTTKVSRYELIADQSEFLSAEQVNAARRLLPVDVLLHLTGRLLTPEIAFRIKIPEGSDAAGGLVTQQVNQINSNQGEVSRHAFSLIVLNRFATSGAPGTHTQGSTVALNEVNQSVSRVLNNQLNQLSDDYLQGVDINVNIQSLDPSYGQLAQNAEVMVTKQLNDRISISAGGNVNINSNYGSSQFAGDYGVLYRVNRAGSVNLKFFRTSMQNIYTTQLTSQSGFSVNYNREFSRWSRLFKRREMKGDVRKGTQSRN